MKPALQVKFRRYLIKKEAVSKVSVKLFHFSQWNSM